MEGPIPCYIAGNKGYVWDANGAMRLRKRHRVMGCLVGSVAQFKNQNEVNYLPLELSADEVTLAAQQGWVELFPETSAPVRAAAAMAAALAPAGRAATGDCGSSSAKRILTLDPDWEAAYQEYYSQYDLRVGFTGRFLPVIGAKRQQLSHPKQQQHDCGYEDHSAVFEATRHVRTETTQGIVMGAPQSPPVEAVPMEQAVDRSEPEWRAAVTDGGSYSLPLTAAVAAAARAGGTVTPSMEAAEAICGTMAAGSSGSGCKATIGRCAISGNYPIAEDRTKATTAAVEVRDAPDGGRNRVGWSYPVTPQERLRFAVFCDLHRRGFMMTGGIKFGSDMLAYPGDPSLYHAQFTVRPVFAEEALNPMVLKAVARGSHAARKHMLLAFFEEEQSSGQGANGAEVQPPRIKYMSFAPEAGFGSKE